MVKIEEIKKGTFVITFGDEYLIIPNEKIAKEFYENIKRRYINGYK